MVSSDRGARVFYLVPSSIPRRRHVRRIAVLALTAITLVVVAFSGSFGRAQTIGSYRPELLAAALSNGCWPLPAGVVFDFPFQVRSDGDVGPAGHERRRLVMQFDLMGADTARQQVSDALVSAGFVESGSPRSADLAFVKSGFGRVDLDVTALEGVPDDSIVRGTIVLTLPSTQAQSDSPICSDPSSTKRFPPGEQAAS